MQNSAAQPQKMSPRSGVGGILDRIAGPGATDSELYLTLAAGVLAVAGQIAYASLAGLNWNVWQYVFAAFLAFDIAGGVMSNATHSSKLWWHREGRGFRHHFGFVAFHIYPFIVAFLYRPADWIWGVSIYGLLLLSAFFVLKTPAYLQRPVAMLAFMGAIAVSLYAFSPTPGLEWFVPLLFLKLIICHILPEEAKPLSS
jgi:hypothetical protein